MMRRKAVILVSGGLDSATVLAIAKQQGYDCFALSFDYGQRHSVELERAQQVAQQFGVIEHKIAKIDLGSFGGSALTDTSIDVPDQEQDGIPITYVPARNTVFLSMALGWAEVLQANSIFIGANAVDYSGYPDCRPEFIQAFQTLANVATKLGVEGDAFTIEAPLIAMTKATIIQTGLELGVDYGLTLSCYDPDATGKPCGQCDSCRIRADGFAQAGVVDPALG
ncbi:MAG: 7-cyano-7-deazaguanine synthase QueC [Arenicella sp.]